MHHKFFAAALALVVVHDLRTQINSNRTARALLQEIERLENVVDQTAGDAVEGQVRSRKQIEYMIELLNENNVVVDEFDLIALNFHNS